MRTADLTTALLLMAGGLLVIWDSVRIGIGWGIDGPKSGFFPFWLAVVMLLCCAGIVVQTLRRGDGAAFMSRKAVAPVLTVLVPAIVFVGLIHVVGLYAASTLYMAVYMRWIGRYGWPLVVVVSVGFSVVTFAVFEIWFLVPMPKGPLEAWLGY